MERAAYASDPARSRGRAFPASPSPTRSEFQRDRDRIVHSAAFRRLQYKTQVFLRHEGQHFRTRLTHTLEVSQMARSIARALGLDEDLAEAIALAHDLGHPPFGHAGERALHRKMERFGGFDHNLQALRVVTILESRYAEHDGLNLTWETLEGILKHNGPVITGPPGFDLEPTTHSSLEAQIAAIADDAAYDAHDIDDALRAGLIILADLRDVPLVGPIVQEVESRWPDLERRRQAHEVQRRLITLMIEDVIATTRAAVAEASPGSVEDVRALDHALVAFSPDVADAEHALKRFMFEHVYRSEPVMIPVRRSETLLAELFDSYLAGVPLTGRWAPLMADAPDEHVRARIICDYIAGMTDPFAEQQHARVAGSQG